MFGKKRDKLDNLSVKELEQILKIRQREARKERFLRRSAEGASINAALLEQDDVVGAVAAPRASNAGLLQTPHIFSLKEKGSPLARADLNTLPARKTWRDRILVLFEVGALVGLIVILIVSYQNLRQLNKEVVEARGFNQTEAATAAVVQPLVEAERNPAPSAFDVELLPGGHSSPTSEGGARPEIPDHLQNWVQPAPAIPVPKQSAAVATRIVIPKLNVDAPIIAGVSWEDLKKGVGHLPGSAQPGQRGNLYLAAHNDIFGEIFRYLEKLEPGDEYRIYAGEAKYTYVVREKRIIEPTEVEVMLPTTEPVATLQTCYPYLIDTHRLVIIGNLVD